MQTTRPDRLRALLLAAALSGLAACSTTQLRPLEDFSPTRIHQEIKPGDRIRVTTLSGKVFELEVLSMEANVIHGRTDEGKPYRVDFEAIRKIEVERVAGWKIVSGISATIGTLAVLAVAVLLYALANW